MMTNNSHVKLLKKDLHSVLKKEISGKDVCLLDLPNYSNPGDQLIWKGEEDILKYLKINVKYRASVYYFNPKLILPDHCILMHGGGNFGDLYTKHQNFREYIINKFPNNKIIILPSTIFFSKEKNLKHTAKLFSKHKNLIICARDSNSLKILKKHFIKNRHYLLTDPAFVITKMGPIKKIRETSKILMINRTDIEKVNFSHESLGFINNLEVSDWPTNTKMEFFIYLELLSIVINRTIIGILKTFGLHWNKKYDIYGFIKFNSQSRQIHSAIKFVSNYKLIITNRLHGHILATILGIPNILLNNSYGKNKHFYNTWIKGKFSNSFYAETPVEIKRIMIKNFAQHISIKKE